MTTSIGFDSVECIIFVFCNWYLRKPDDQPVYRTYFSELFVFVKCCHASNALITNFLNGFFYPPIFHVISDLYQQ